jgi:hypothetical protein
MDTMNIFNKYGLNYSRMISASKSTYKQNHPQNRVIFNANIVTDNGKIWYGDLDLTISEKELMSISGELSQDLYVLYEMDGRFENENKSAEELKTKAAYIVSHDKIIIGEKYKNYLK